MRIAVYRLLCLTLLSLTFISWGFYGHRKINRYAVFALPPEMIGFYKRHIEFLTEHAVDPDKRRYVSEKEAVKHYIDLDHYGYSKEDVFDSIPNSWKKAVAKFSEDTLKSYGILPWNMVWVFHNLTTALENKNCERILSLSADLGHYIGDAHVPLHTTENYNGQLTGQKGIHGLWESRIPEIQAESYNLFCGRAEYVQDPLLLAWEIVKESHWLVDSVLDLERQVTLAIGRNKKYELVDRGGVVSMNYSIDFSEFYANKMNRMVERRMHLAVKRVASFWFTAWVNAGQPDLNELVLGKREWRNKENLDSAYRASTIKGRAHSE